MRGFGNNQVAVGAYIDPYKDLQNVLSNTQDRWAKEANAKALAEQRALENQRADTRLGLAQAKYQTDLDSQIQADAIKGYEIANKIETDEAQRVREAALDKDKYATNKLKREVSGLELDALRKKAADEKASEALYNRLQAMPKSRTVTNAPQIAKTNEYNTLIAEANKNLPEAQQAFDREVTNFFQKAYNSPTIAHLSDAQKELGAKEAVKARFGNIKLEPTAPLPVAEAANVQVPLTKAELKKERARILRESSAPASVKQGYALTPAEKQAQALGVKYAEEFMKNKGKWAGAIAGGWSKGTKGKSGAPTPAAIEAAKNVIRTINSQQMTDDDTKLYEDAEAVLLKAGVPYSKPSVLNITHEGLNTPY